MNVTAPPKPTAAPPIQMKSPKKRAQRNDDDRRDRWRGSEGASRADPTERTHRSWTIKFTEPVALLSTFPVNLRLPPTALGSGFDLLALRARCKREARGRAPVVQGVEKRLVRNLRILPQSAVRNSAGCRALQRRSDQKFTEPVALSSTFPVNLRLPPTALGSGFDLLALRARCQKNVPSGTGPNQEGRGAEKPRSLRVGAWGNPVDDGQARSSESNRRNNPGRSSNAPGSWMRVDQRGDPGRHHDQVAGRSSRRVPEGVRDRRAARARPRRQAPRDARRHG